MRGEATRAANTVRASLKGAGAAVEARARQMYAEDTRDTILCGWLAAPEAVKERYHELAAAEKAN